MANNIGGDVRESRGSVQLPTNLTKNSLIERFVPKAPPKPTNTTLEHCIEEYEDSKRLTPEDFVHGEYRAKFYRGHHGIIGSSCDIYKNQERIGTVYYDFENKQWICSGLWYGHTEQELEPMIKVLPLPIKLKRPKGYKECDGCGEPVPKEELTRGYFCSECLRI